MGNKGILNAFGAYFIWGLVPVYWKLIKHVPAIQLIGHRIIWSFILLAAVLLVTRKWPELCSLGFQSKGSSHLFCCRRSCGIQLVYLCLGGQFRIHPRGKPRVLYQSAFQRAPRRCLPAGTPAPRSVALGRIGRNRGSVPHDSLWPAPMDCPRPNCHVRLVWAGKEKPLR